LARAFAAEPLDAREISMKPTILAVVFGVAAALPPALASTDELPTRKAGLWESKMTSSEGNLPSMTMKQCVDAETDKAALMSVPADMCDVKVNRLAPDRIETQTNCKRGPVTASGKGVITGDFDTNVRVEMTTTTVTSPDALPADMPKINIPPQTQSMVIEARWLGPCEPGQKPGDVIMPDGKVMQLPSLQGKK
jgi:hypothetical protein